MTERVVPEFRPFPVIIAAPSGAGKTSIAQGLRQRRSDVVFSISATTRPARSYELHGRDYWFLSEDEFRDWIAAGKLLEWAEVHGHLYGTPALNLEQAADRGQFLLLDIDVQGARQVRRLVPHAVAVFVLPPSGRALAERLLSRASEREEVRRRRLANATTELALASEFDYVVVNDDLDRAVGEVDCILRSEARRVGRAVGLGEHVEQLRQQVSEVSAG